MEQKLSPLGSMQRHPLLVSALLRHAETLHGDVEIVSRRAEGDIHRTNWRDVAKRSARIAHWLDRKGIPAGARIGTLAWNDYRHVEVYYGVSASGRILHTVNPRLSPEQISWIINDAQDRVVFFDPTLTTLVQAVRALCPSVITWVAMGPAEAEFEPYEQVLGSIGDVAYAWPDLAEDHACSLCYTSGTTGHPKGVQYSHRSTVLHAFAAALPDSLNLSARDSVLPVVPMFHVNAWGIPYAAAMTGARLVLPGHKLDGASLYQLIESEGVTMSAGVPTVWQGLLDHTAKHGLSFSTLRRTVVGGSACPPTMIDSFERMHGVDTVHAWGMTELSPLGVVNTLKHKHLSLPPEEQASHRLSQGRPPFGIEMKLADDQDQSIAWDGVTPGRLLVRGHWVVEQYFNHGEPATTEGWFDTGDMATLTDDGYLNITDRTKDLIKSGGEWISSITLENIALQHPDVQAAACFAMADEKWGERPCLAVVPREGHAPDEDSILRFFADRVPRWQAPDRVHFVTRLPIGGTGKVMKHLLRKQYSVQQG